MNDKPVEYRYTVTVDQVDFANLPMGIYRDVSSVKLDGAGVVLTCVGNMRHDW